MPVPEMTPVSSSNLHSVGHDGEALYVRFRGKDGPGRLYRYPTAGREHYEGLLAAPSAGSYFLDQLKFGHVGERVHE